jgi:hypothetical protein
MTKQQTLVSGVVALLAVAIVSFAALPQPAKAATVAEQRAALIEEIYRLIAQIALLDGRIITFEPMSRGETTTRTSTRIIPTGNVASRVEVETLRAIDVEDEEASVYGDVNLNGQRYADVWFEYGEDDDDLDERSRMGRIDRNDRSTFRADLEDLDEDEKYYYRAVAEDPQGRRDYGRVRNFETDRNGRSSSRDDEPEVDTGRASDIDENSAELEGEVDMNDFEDGRVFVIYGEDEDQIADVEDDYDTYNEVDEDGDDLQKVLIDSSLDDDASYDVSLFSLDDDTEYFYTFCVQYEDEDDDDAIICGSVEDFETDRD